MKFNQCIAIILAAFLIQFLAADRGYAIPAFTRAYKVECTTCHTIYPELNEYGEAFLKNSYVYFGKAKKGEKKDAPAPLASPAKSAAPAGDMKILGEGDAAKLSKLKAGAMGASESATPAAEQPATAGTAAGDDQKPEGLLLSGVPEQLPISFTGSINYAYDTSKTNELDFAARSIKMHAGGNFREMIGFYATYVAYSEQPPVGTYNTSSIASNNKTDINEMLLSWRHMFNTPFNMRIGRMQPKLGLWKTNNKLSVTNNYLPYTYSVGNESQFKIEQPQDAIELNAVLANRFYLAGGIVNRKGQSTKEGYGHASFKFGGADFLANEPDVDLAKEESILDFLTVTLGTYGYSGENGTANSNYPKNSYYRVGVDAELLYKIFRLRMLGGYGEDDNAAPSTLISKQKVISKAMTVEGELTMLLNLIAAGRFEYLQQESANQAFIDVYVRRYIGTLAYAPIENVKLALEYKYEVLQNTINRIGTLGATFSF